VFEQHIFLHPTLFRVVKIGFLDQLVGDFFKNPCIIHTTNVDAGDTRVNVPKIALMSSFMHFL